MVPPEFWICAAVCLGAIFGSFINMAAYRLPRGISTWKRARSFCPKCDHELAWYDNIPILSYVSLLGKCRYCRVPIPSRYLITELIVSGLFALAAYQYFSLNGGPGGRMPAAVFGALLFLIVDFVLLSVVDWESYLIPIETTLWWIIPALIAGVIFPELHAPITTWSGSTRVDALIDGLIGIVTGGALLWLVGAFVTAYFYLRNTLRGIREAPPEAMGMGDVHMMMLFGALFGWKPALMAILCGVMIGALGVVKILYNKIQRWRLGDKWKPKPPTFDLPEDGAPYEPRLWMPLVFGAATFVGAICLDQHRRTLITGGDYNHFVPVTLLYVFGIGMGAAGLFNIYLKKKGLQPGGQILENAEGKKEEVYHGNYIPFGPSLAAGAIFVAFCDPLLRAYAYMFFVDPTASPMWSYRIVGQSWIAGGLQWILGGFMLVSEWLRGVVGVR